MTLVRQLRSARWQAVYWRSRVAVIEIRGQIEVVPAGRLEHLDSRTYVNHAMYRPLGMKAELYGGELLRLRMIHDQELAA